jgi:hypothetical protein
MLLTVRIKKRFALLFAMPIRMVNTLTISSLSEFLQNQAPNLRFHPVTLTRTLDRWGFEFGKGKRSQHLFEADEIMATKSKILTTHKSQ